MFKQDIHTFLITNKHVIQTAISRSCDSIMIFENKVLPNGDVISGPSITVIHFVKADQKYYYLPVDARFDLALISLGRNNIDTEIIDEYGFFPANRIVGDLTRLFANLDSTENNFILTMIGFPSKYILMAERTQEFLWGDFLWIEGNRIISNIPAQRGSSGSPIFLRHEGIYYLFGIHFGRDKPNKTIALPLIYMYSCFPSYFDKIKGQD